MFFVSPESLSAPSSEDSPVRAGKTTTLQYNKDMNYISRPLLVLHRQAGLGQSCR